MDFLYYDSESYLSSISYYEAPVQLEMEEISWISDYADDTRRKTREFGSFLEPGEEGDKEAPVVSMDLILPEDMLECILAHRPIASIFRAGYVKDAGDCYFKKVFVEPCTCSASRTLALYVYKL